MVFFYFLALGKRKEGGLVSKPKIEPEIKAILNKYGIDQNPFERSQGERHITFSSSRNPLRSRNQLEGKINNLEIG